MAVLPVRFTFRTDEGLLQRRLYTCAGRSLRQACEEHMTEVTRANRRFESCRHWQALLSTNEKAGNNLVRICTKVVFYKNIRKSPNIAKYMRYKLLKFHVLNKEYKTKYGKTNIMNFGAI